MEYAGKAVENSSTAIALRCKSGIVIAVEKLIQNKLYEEDSCPRIHSIDTHIGLAMSGLIADGNHIVDTARQEASNYKQEFNRPIPVKILNDRLSSYIHAYTLYSAVRPFGISVILASYNESTGPEMYLIDPSGVSHVRWKSSVTSSFILPLLCILGLFRLCHGQGKAGGQDRDRENPTGECHNGRIARSCC